MVGPGTFVSSRCCLVVAVFKYACKTVLFSAQCFLIFYVGPTVGDAIRGYRPTTCSLHHRRRRRRHIRAHRAPSTRDAIHKKKQVTSRSQIKTIKSDDPVLVPLLGLGLLLYVPYVGVACDHRIRIGYPLTCLEE